MENDYPWDTIQVGFPEIENSREFFKFRHETHESIKVISDKLKGITFINKGILKDQGNLKSSKTSLVKKATDLRCSTSKSFQLTEKKLQKVELASEDKENISSINNNVAAARKPVNNKFAVSNKLTTQSKSNPSTVNEKSDRVNIIDHQMWKKVIPASVRQFDYAKQQAKRKEERIKKLDEQAKKDLLKFKFHAKAAPKMKKVVTKQKEITDGLISKESSNKLALKSPKEKMTLNYRPSKKSQSGIVKAVDLKKSDEIKKPEFRAKPATVLKKQPFKPSLNNMKVTDSKPFNLHLTTRLIQRSEFNKKQQEKIAILKKQQEIFKRQQENEDRKQMRQKTEFRANPIRLYH